MNSNFVEKTGDLITLQEPDDGVNGTYRFIGTLTFPEGTRGIGAFNRAEATLVGEVRTQNWKTKWIVNGTYQQTHVEDIAIWKFKGNAKVPGQASNSDPLKDEIRADYGRELRDRNVQLIPNDSGEYRQNQEILAKKGFGFNLRISKYKEYFEDIDDDKYLDEKDFAVNIHGDVTIMDR